MKKGKVEFHSRGQSGNIYYIIGAVREVMKNRVESWNITICGMKYKTPKATKRH